MNRNTPVTACNGYLKVGDEIVPLWSGEFHFWRVPAQYWEAVLNKIGELGLKLVSTYVAWNFHEIERGHYDFTGETTPEHNLAGFLDLTRKMGFKVLVRPGPYIHAEWANGGPTDEAVQYHRLDPRFKKLASEWIQGVSGVIAPFQATRGGHVVALQPDNEPWAEIANYGVELGCYQEPGMFKDWIAERYCGDIAKLNAAWRTGYADFSSVCLNWEEAAINRITMPENARLIPDPEHEVRILDSQEFVEWYCREILRWSAEEYRKAGIDIPFYTNTWSPYAHNLHDALDVVDFAGIDSYPSAFFESCSWAPGGVDWDYYIEGLKVAENSTGWGYYPEFGSGFWEGNGYAEKSLTPQSTAFLHRSLMANGAKGWNWYMLVCRDNWYHSPINLIGAQTVYFDAYKRTVSLAKTISLHKLERAPAVSLVTLRRQRFTDSGNWQDLWNSLISSGVDFETADSRYGRLKCDLILYGGSSYIEADEADNLRRAVEDGSTLLCFNRMPLMNRAGESINPFGLPNPDGQRPINSPFTIAWSGGSGEVPRGGHAGRIQILYFHQIPPDSKPIYAIPSTSKEHVRAYLKDGALPREAICMGFIKPFGKGKVVVLGIAPHPGIVPILPEVTGCSLRAVARTNNVALTFWNDGPDRYVFIINRNPADTVVEAWFDLKTFQEAVTVEDVESGEMHIIEQSGRTFVPVRGHDVVVGKIWCRNNP